MTYEIHFSLDSQSKNPYSATYEGFTLQRGLGRGIVNIVGGGEHVSFYHNVKVVMKDIKSKVRQGKKFEHFFSDDLQAQLGSEVIELADRLFGQLNDGESIDATLDEIKAKTM